MNTLTAEEIAELRKLAADAAPGVWKACTFRDVYETVTRKALPRLLDEVERWRHARDFANMVAGTDCPHGGHHAPYCISCCAQFDPKRMALIHEQRCYFLIHERAASLATSG